VTYPAESVSNLTLTSATVHTGINPSFQSTKYSVEYSNVEASLGTPEATIAPGGVVEENEEPVSPSAVSVVVSGLIPHEHYYYRVIAENNSTENLSNADKGVPVKGEIKEFTTESLPFVSTGAAANITGTGATLSGSVTAPLQNATYYFQYVSETAYKTALKEGIADPYEDGETTTPLPISASESAQAVGPVLVGGLRPGETYHYRLVSKNQFGLRDGEPGEADHTFTTLGATPPVVSTGGASGVGQTTATISGTVDTNSLQTDYGFEIATSPGDFGGTGTITGLGSLGGATTQNVSVTLGELQPGITYYYRVTASNADGTVQGAEQSFTTAALPTLFTIPTSLPLYNGYVVPLPKESGAGTTTITKTLTNKQKLSKALKVCKRDKSKTKRQGCEKAAHKKYPVASKKKAKGKKK
jgi:hypothetical protein